LSIDEEEAEDLLVTIEREVRRRDRGSAVRLEIAAGAEPQMVDYLVRALKLGAADVYRPEGPLNIPDLLPLLGRIEQKELRDEPFTPVVPPQLGDAERDLFRLLRYVHLGTGHYIPVTARIYEDLSVFTARHDFGADATSLFNLLTGYSKPAAWKKFRVAPLNLKSAVLELIEREAQIARESGS